MEDKFRFTQFAVDKAPEAIFWLDADGNIVYVNDNTCQMLGYSRDELLSMTVFDIDVRYTREIWPQRWKHLREKGSLTVESNQRTKEGHVFPVEIKVNIVEFEGKEYNCAFVRNITERNQAEAALKESENRFRMEKAYLDQLFENAQEAIVISDVEHRILRINEEFTRLFGYSKEEARDRMIDDLIAPDDRRKEAFTYTSELGKGIKISFEAPRRCKNGDLKYVSAIGSPIKVDDTIVAHYSIYRDISARKEAEAKLKASLKEKEVLLSEIHHRVKNNLQIVSSLLRLQSSNISDEHLLGMFKESQNRINSMALIHESLYQSEDIAKINFSDYIQRLTNNLSAVYSKDLDSVRVLTKVKDVYLDINKAIPCGLIINELVTNAMKHAFPNGKIGEILVQMEKDDHLRHALTIRDNGKGIPKNFNFHTTTTLGMMLVNELTLQLNGTIELKREQGTEFIIRFSVSD